LRLESKIAPLNEYDTDAASLSKRPARYYIPTASGALPADRITALWDISFDCRPNTRIEA